jgi:small conductance mechanosensitive channel
MHILYQPFFIVIISDYRMVKVGSIKYNTIQMTEEPRPKNGPLSRLNRSTTIVFGVMLACIAVIVVTIELARVPQFVFISDHRKALISGEFTIFVIALVEVIGRIVIARFRKRGFESVGYSIRAVLRGAAYIFLTIGITSSLASNPALAISIGAISGVIIGFATQNVLGNIVAGMILAIVRPIRVGDDITVSGSSGRVKEIALIYTVLDAPDNLYYIPNAVMFSNAVTRRKSSITKERNPRKNSIT